MTRTALTHGWARLARAGVLGAASLFLATAAHTIGGGTLPGAGLLILLGVGLGLAAVSLTARRLRFGALLAVLIVEQLLLHLVLHAATTAAACAPVVSHHALSAGTLCGAGSAASTGWLMTIAHLLAVLATAWLLARGERWLWRTVQQAHAYATARIRGRCRRLRPTAVSARAVLRPARFGWLVAGPRAPPLALI